MTNNRMTHAREINGTTFAEHWQRMQEAIEQVKNDPVVKDWPPSVQAEVAKLTDQADQIIWDLTAAIGDDVAMTIALQNASDMMAKAMVFHRYWPHEQERREAMQ